MTEKTKAPRRQGEEAWKATTNQGITMTARLTLTPEDNVQNGRVIDPTKLTRCTHDWDDHIPVLESASRKPSRVQVRSVSLYDHLVVLNDQPHHILHMFSK
jgi:hypothetical protein